jgi:hypothetical protein
MMTVEQRLQTLERDYQRLRMLNWLLALTALTVVCAAAAPVASEQRQGDQSAAAPGRQAVPSAVDNSLDHRPLTVETEQLSLRDQQGRPRLRLAITEAGAAISMLDPEGHPRVILDHTGLRLLDSHGTSTGSLHMPAGTEQAQLELRSSQGSSLAQPAGFFIRDAAEQNSVYLALINGNFPVCGISGHASNGPPTVEITASGGEGRIKLHDQQGRPVFWVATRAQGTAELTLSQATGRQSLNLSAGTPDGAGPAITFVGPAEPDGSAGLLPRMVLGIDPVDNPFIRISDAAGRSRFTVPTTADSD